MAMSRQEKLKILAEAVNTFGKKEWFRDATIYDKFPTNGEPTIELKVNYMPLFERKEIKEFAVRFNLVDRYLIVDRDGNPAQ